MDGTYRSRFPPSYLVKCDNDTPLEVTERPIWSMVEASVSQGRQSDTLVARREVGCLWMFEGKPYSLSGLSTGEGGVSPSWGSQLEDLSDPARLSLSLSDLSNFPLEMKSQFFQLPQKG